MIKPVTVPCMKVCVVRALNMASTRSEMMKGNTRRAKKRLDFLYEEGTFAVDEDCKPNE